MSGKSVVWDGSGARHGVSMRPKGAHLPGSPASMQIHPAQAFAGVAGSGSAFRMQSPFFQ